MNTRSKNNQKVLVVISRIVAGLVFSLSAFAAAPVGKSSAGTQQPDAAAILARMADFLSKAPHFKVTVQSSYDAVQPDGLKVDSAGNIWSTGPGGIRIISPQGKVLGQLVVPETVANIGFAEDGKTVYLTG